MFGARFLDTRFLSYVSICNGCKTNNTSFEIWELKLIILKNSITLLQDINGNEKNQNMILDLISV